MINNSRISFPLRFIFTMVNMLYLILIAAVALFIGYLASKLNLVSYAEEIDMSVNMGMSIIWTIVLFPVFLFVNQDNVNSSGIVKRILGLQIVSTKTNQPASPLKCIVSNLTFFFPIDSFIWAMTPDRGIGDYLVGTRLIRKSENFNNQNVYRIKGYLLYVVNSLIIALLAASILSFMFSPGTYVSESSFYKTEQVNDSTEIQRKYFDNGALNIEFMMMNGKYNGFYKEWNEDGNLQSSIEYRHGARNGITTTFYSNGIKESEALYSNNEFVKYIKRWDMKGNPIEITEPNNLE